MNGSVDRDGEKSYLLRLDRPDKNNVVVCLIGTDGLIRKWYGGWRKAYTDGKPGKLVEIVGRASEFVLAHHVLTA